ncbi:rhodanese-like domain-containing protein [Natronolimnohabitans innermongolicus]|uniref:Rhodanese domain-containing protein n=1 Tax=Natronolimnohabitans innermongolicus JCM 12255 TaxID=1227499 RepID=L9XK04_9EURY|nr:rhodanese-like domain-containing protein [Natronolimnohabitans innermongolicus]ELY62099.1 hypothetical protein C493_00750 [Natronolimnohabitans innermongolicus JCM 12255]
MERSRRAILEAGIGTVSIAALAGCTGSGSDTEGDGTDEAAETDDDSTPTGDEGETEREETDDDGTESESDPTAANGVELLAEASVDHIHACSHAKFDDREPLEAAETSDAAPTVGRTHVIWAVEYDDEYGQVVFDASGYPGSIVFYTADGSAYAVVGTELEREPVDDDTCEYLDRYVEVAPEDGRIELVLTDDPGLETDEWDDEDRDESGSSEGEGEYETYTVGEIDVPLAPTTDVADWYENDNDLIIVDARSRTAYDQLHIDGAVSSPAPDGRSTDDPLADVATDTRIVTYCPCPYVLAGQRAASLIEDGYTEVYALKEGVQEWIDRDYPIDGTAGN